MILFNPLYLSKVVFRNIFWYNRYMCVGDTIPLKRYSHKYNFSFPFRYEQKVCISCLVVSGSSDPMDLADQFLCPWIAGQNWPLQKCHNQEAQAVFTLYTHTHRAVTGNTACHLTAERPLGYETRTLQVTQCQKEPRQCALIIAVNVPSSVLRIQGCGEISIKTGDPPITKAAQLTLTTFQAFFWNSGHITPQAHNLKSTEFRTCHLISWDKGRAEGLPNFRYKESVAQDLCGCHLQYSWDFDFILEAMRAEAAQVKCCQSLMWLYGLVMDLLL